MEDITGQVYNDLTALRPAAHIPGRGQVWVWRCVCGKEVEQSISRVRRGHDLSCGCRRHRDKESKKICRYCGELSYRKNRHGNFASVCQRCDNKRTNGFKGRNPERFMVTCARQRAKKQGVPCTITHEDFTIPEFCPVLGIKLERGTRTDRDASPSLDKIIPELGYVPGNVIIMSFRANRFKSDASIEELETVLNWMKEHSRPVLLPAEVAA